MNVFTLQNDTAVMGGAGGQLARRLAKAGFWFFFAKGLLWLATPAIAWLAVS